MGADVLSVGSGCDTRMTDSQREWIEERAAILEHDAGYDRATAERIAAHLWARWEAEHG